MHRAKGSPRAPRRMFSHSHSRLKIKMELVLIYLLSSLSPPPPSHNHRRFPIISSLIPQTPTTSWLVHRSNPVTDSRKPSSPNLVRKGEREMCLFTTTTYTSCGHIVQSMAGTSPQCNPRNPHVNGFFRTVTSNTKCPRCIDDAERWLQQTKNHRVVEWLNSIEQSRAPGTRLGA